MLRRLLIVFWISIPAIAGAQQWSRLPSLPDTEGLAGSFAGLSYGTLLVAGGANFPDKKPWEGGTKVWYPTIYALEANSQQWTIVGNLPSPRGYGVSVSIPQGLLCIGGSDSEAHYAEAFLIEYRDRKLRILPFPSLPMTLANACGISNENRVYVFGGQRTPTDPKAIRDVFRFQWDAPSNDWIAMEKIPGVGRILAAAGAIDRDIYLLGGAELWQDKDGKIARTYLSDAFRWNEKDGWSSIPNLPSPSVAAPSPAITFQRSLWLLGGDDGSQLSVPANQHRGFSKQVMKYDSEQRRWTSDALLPFAHVTAPVVARGNQWIVVSGEIKPGIRTPEVWSGDWTQSTQ